MSARLMLGAARAAAAEEAATAQRMRSICLQLSTEGRLHRQEGLPGIPKRGRNRDLFIYVIELGLMGKENTECAEC